MNQKLFLVYANVSLLCVLLVGMELFGQIAFVVWKGYPLYESDRHLVVTGQRQAFELHPFLVGRLRSDLTLRSDGKELRSTPMHTRWTGASPDDSNTIRVAVVGGSTTFGAGVSDADSWPARLQAILGAGYSITNYGMLGYSSAEGVIQLGLLVPESRPDVVILYEGWNDLHNYHDSALGPDYYSHGLRQYGNLAIERPRPEGLFAKLVEVSAVVRLAQVLARALPSPARRDTVAPGQLINRSDPEPDPFVERIYRRNLASLRVLTAQTGAYALFVPQVLDLSRFKGDTTSWWTPHIRNSAMPGLLGRMNAILGQTCGDSPARCAVLDGVLDRNWQPDDFIDEGHFSVQGNEAFARLMADRIAALAKAGQLRPAARPQARPGGPSDRSGSKR